MARDEQNVVVRGGVVGTLATTSYGPRKVATGTPGIRPMSPVRREIVLDLDGDVVDTLTADFANNTKHALPAGCFVVDAYAVSKTGATIALNLEDSEGTVSAPIALAPAANEWAASRDLDLNVEFKSQIIGTIGAGETATVVIGYLQADSETAVDGVLAKAGADQDDSSTL